MSERHPLRITIVGAGAIGGLLAAGLARAGHQVSLLARGRTLDALQSHGLRVIENGTETSWQLPASATAGTFGVQDFVIIALKAQALPSLASSLAPVIGAETVIVSAMNGLPWWFGHGLAGFEGKPIEAVDPAGVVSAALPPERALGCVVHLSASTDAPGVIRHARGNELIIGAADARLAPRAAVLAAALRSGGFDARESGEVRREIWLKAWGNMNMNPISALTGASADRILDDPLTLALVKRMMAEAAQLGERLGLASAPGAIDARIAVTRKLGAFRTSMLQDSEAGRELELEPILGVFPELGARFGVSMPFSETVLGLLRQRVATAKS